MAKTSRKTKKTWRKNIDLNDVESGFQQNKDDEIFGKQDFVIDTSSKEVKNAKKLKSSEILTNKSKINLPLERNNKPEKGKTVNRLMKIAGKIDNSTSMASVDKNGLINADNKDLWDDSDNDNGNSNDNGNDDNDPNAKLPIKKPKTMEFGPIQLHGQQDLGIVSGQSYNPSLESWKQLINKEYELEKINELNRQELAEKQELIERLIKEVDEDSDDDDDDENDENDKDDDENKNDKDINKDNQSDQQSQPSFKLSANKPTENKKKTKYQRNKELRNQKRLQLQQNLKALKHQIHEISQLENIETEAKPLQHVSKPKDKKVKKLYKYQNINKPLEVKLSNELTGNLKNLKSEGNLLVSNFNHLQSKGIIEARVPVAKKQKYKPKVTEKWTYKDFN